MPARRCILVVSAAAVLVAAAQLGARPVAAPPCPPPPYVVGQFDTGDEEFRAVAVAISPRDFTRETLRCLVSSLKDKYSRPKALSFLIFDSKAAVSRYAGRAEEREQVDLEIASHLHAIYFRDAGQEFLEMKPLGDDRTAALDSRVDFAVNRPTDCKVSIRSRCLMAVGWLGAHRVDAKGTGTPDQVKLGAQLARDGRFTRVGIVDQSLKGSTREFARWLVENLKTWRFEAAPGGHVIDVSLTAAVSTSAAAPRMAVEIDEAGPTISIRVTFAGPW